MIMKKFILLFLWLCYCIGSFGQKRSQADFFISADFGIGILMGKSNLSPVGNDYRKEYKTGITANLISFYSFNKRVGIGVKYNYFGTSGEYDLVGEHVNYKDDICIHYIAPQFGYFMVLNRNFRLNYGIGIGIMHYKNNVGSMEWKTSSNSLATNIDVNLTYKITKNVSFQTGLSYLKGNNFKKVKQNVDGIESSLIWENERRIRLHRIDYTIGITGHF